MTFGQKTSVKTHVLTIHDGHKPFECPSPKCQKTFSQKGNMKTHMASAHKGQKYHMSSEYEDKKTFQCSKCPKTFSHNKHMNRHVASVHEGQKPYECLKCPMTFTQNSDKERHVTTVHEGLLFVCPKCLQAFTQKQGLKRHMATVHEGKTKKPFECSKCPAMFSRKWHMNNHMASTHEGKKPFGCSKCQKNFSFKTTLKRHMANVHDEGKKSLNVSKHTKNSKGQSSMENVGKFLKTLRNGYQCKLCGLIMPCLTTGLKSKSMASALKHVLEKHEIDRDEQNVKNMAGIIIEQDTKVFDDYDQFKKEHEETMDFEEVKSTKDSEHNLKIDHSEFEQNIGISLLTNIKEEIDVTLYSENNPEMHGQDPTALNNIYICPICKSKFGSISLTENHILQFHNIPINVQHQMQAFGLKIETISLN